MKPDRKPNHAADGENLSGQRVNWNLCPGDMIQVPGTQSPAYRVTVTKPGQVMLEWHTIEGAECEGYATYQELWDKGALYL
jgi:hypothetical protein